jgi:hypothetical protein
MASPRISSEETLSIVEKQRQERLESTKNFLIGFAKTATTDLPGFLMDVADKMAGDTATLGEKDWSARLFEAMTGIKTKSGEGGVDELLGGMINPAGAAKAVIIPAIKLGKGVEQAKTLAKAGMSPATIFDQAGMFKEKGVWKAAISDAGVKIKRDGVTNYAGITNLDKLLDADQLFKLYPELKNTKVMFTEGVSGAVFYPGAGKLPPVVHVNPEIAASDQLKSILLHEVQHGIQEAEKFSRGTSVASILSRNPGLSYQEAFNIYKNVPGEREASFVERAADLTQAQLDLEVKKILQASGTPGSPSRLEASLDRFVSPTDPSQVIIPARLGPAAAAKNMEAAGKSADEIYQATKTYRDSVTNALKEVIPDTGADFLPGAINIKLGPQNPFVAHNNPSRVGELAHDIFTDKTLGDVLSHPFMDDLMGVEAAKVGRLILAPGVRGSFNPDKDTIRLADNVDPNQMLSTLLHETQHALQFRAGTQGGGNPGMFFADGDAFEASKRSALKLSSVLAAEFDKAFKGSQGLEQYNSPSFTLQNFIAETEIEGIFGELAKRQLDKIPVKTLSAYRPVQEAKKAVSTLSKASDDALQGYKNLLGEAEARLVQTQHKLGDYTTHPLKLMADELGVRIDDLPKVLIGDASEIKPVDVSPEVKEAMEFVEKLMQARAAQGNPIK